MTRNIRLLEAPALPEPKRDASATPRPDAARAESAALGRALEQPRGGLVCIPWRSGAAVELDSAAERLAIRAGDGQVQLTVRMTREGLVLSFGAASLEIEQTGTLRVAVDKLQLEARNGIEIDARGPISQRVAGDITTHCAGRLQLECAEASVIAHTGELKLDATHDLAINGERVLINC